MVQSCCTCTSNEHPAQYQFDRLKSDQALFFGGVPIPTDIFGWSGADTQEKKLKNWYIQDHTAGTKFEPIFKKKSQNKSNDDMDG